MSITDIDCFCFYQLAIYHLNCLGYERYNEAQIWQPEASGGYHQSEPYVTPEGTFACPSCGKTFTSKRSWKNHNAVHDQ